MRTKTLAALAAAALVIAGGSYAYGATAAAPIASTSITSLTFCQSTDGTLKAVALTVACPKGTTRYTLTGVAGPRGITGLPGATGATGATGAQGVPGPIGPTGPAGPTGPKGDTGLQGASGSQGLLGPAGPQGLQGLPGASGAPGAQGLPGTDGANGVVGAQGSAGPKGDTGATGPAGPSGQVGVGGYQGFTSDGTFTVPAGVTHILVEAWGAGGSTASYNLGYPWMSSRGDGGTYVRTVISVSPGEVLTVHTGRAVFGAGQATTVSASDSTVLVDAPGGSGREYVNSTDSFPTVQPSDTLVAGTSTLTLGQQPPYGSLLPSVFAAGGVPFVNSQAPSAPFVYGSRFVPHVTGSGFYTQWLGGNGEADLQW